MCTTPEYIIQVYAYKGACIYKWLCIFSVAASISFNQSTYIVNENDRLVQVVLVLNKTVASNITVRVRTDDNTATGMHAESIHKNNIVFTGGGVDYNSGPYIVTFPAGEISVSFNITINIDTVLEYTETFNLIIIKDSRPENIILGKIDITEVTIVNDGGSGEYAVN